MKQFLPDQDRSSLRHTRAFPPSVSVNNNHAGICVKFFMKLLYVHSWNTVEKMNVSTIGLQIGGDIMDMKCAWKCRKLCVCTKDGSDSAGSYWERAARDTVFNQHNLVRAQVKMIPAHSRACWVELSIPAHPPPCALLLIPRKASWRRHIGRPREEASVNKMGDSRRFFLLKE